MILEHGPDTFAAAVTSVSPDMLRLSVYL